jgi:phosphoglycolate phosphatase
MLNSAPDQITTLIFDFDGTICDSYVAALESFNSLSEEFHYKRIPAERFESLRDLNSKDLFGTMEISPNLLQKVVERVVNSLHTKIGELHPVPGIEKALHALRLNGYRVGVLTSNSEKNVRAFADAHHLEFDFVYGDGQLFAKHELLKSLMSDLSLSIKNVVYIGDETRDIETARKASVKVIAVDWGFNSSKILKEYKPDQLIHSPGELSDAVKF